MKRLIAILAVLLLTTPVTSFAAPSVEDLQAQIAALTAQLQELSKKVDEKAEETATITEDLDDLNDRVDSNEVHSALDRITFTGDIRTKADTLHYQDVTFNPGILVNFDNSFDSIATALTGGSMAGAAGGSLETAQGMISGMFDPDSPYYVGGSEYFPAVADMMTKYPDMAQAFAAYLAYPSGALGNMAFPMADAARTSDINNDIAYTTRLRLNMKAKISENMNFAGRLSMYKNWGDSTTSKVFDSWNAFTMDGTDSGSTSGDWLRVERAYFDWKDIAGTPFYLSIGRRPSTYGNPTNYRENEMRGGTPSGHLVDFNFDGMTIGYHLGDVTGIEGQVIRFCYGQGFESEWGNGELFNNLDSTSDTHLGGFNLDLFNDGQTFVSATLFRAQDVVDGFKGVFAFPTEFVSMFAPTLYADVQKFPTFNFETRYSPSTTIGSMDLVGLGFSREEFNGVNWFGSFGWTRLEPNGEAGMFGGMGTDAVYEAVFSEDKSEIYMVPVAAENDDTQDGFGVYVGVQIPAPLGKFGIEYNYGSKYWTPFTQAQDDMLGSKLATRGHVGEAYYIFDINPSAFIKVGGLYYDYQYTGSGSPVGKPVKIDDIKDGSAYSLLPVVDTAWNAYASMTLKF